MIGGESQTFTAGTVNARYDFAKSRLVIDNSRIDLGRTEIPVAGENQRCRRRFRTVAPVDNGIASSEASGEEPVPFSAKAEGHFTASTKQLEVPSLYVSGPLGDMAGSLKLRFGEGSPEISFAGQIPKMEATAVKQLWPFWMAHKPREWVVSNLYGGTITNGSIAVFIPQGRMCGPGCPLVLRYSEMQIRFDIDDTRLNTTVTFPAARCRCSFRPRRRQRWPSISNRERPISRPTVACVGKQPLPHFRCVRQSRCWEIWS